MRQMNETAIALLRDAIKADPQLAATAHLYLSQVITRHQSFIARNKTHRNKAGGRGRRQSSPLPEAERIYSFRNTNEAQIWPFLLSCKLLKYAF